MSSVLESPNPQRYMSLASRVLARKNALTADELAELLGVSRLTIIRRARKGTIPSFRVGGQVRFDPENTGRWLKQMGVQRASERYERKKAADKITPHR